MGGQFVISLLLLKIWFSKYRTCPGGDAVKRLRTRQDVYPIRENFALIFHGSGLSGFN